MTEVGSPGYTEQTFVQVSATGPYHRHLSSPVEMADAAADHHTSPAGCTTEAFCQPDSSRGLRSSSGRSSPLNAQDELGFLQAYGHW